MKQMINRNIIYLVCVLVVLACKKQKEEPVTANEPVSDPVVTTSNPMPGTNGGGLLNFDPSQIYGQLQYSDLELVDSYPIKGSLFGSKASAKFSNNLAGVSAGTLQGVSAGAVFVGGVSIPFSQGRYFNQFNGWFGTGPITWFIEGSDELPTLTYTTPESFFGFSSIEFPDTVKKGVAFNFTVTNVTAHAASMTLFVSSKQITKQLKNGTAVVSISSSESALLSNPTSLNINLINRYTVSSGEKKLLIERKREYKSSFKTLP